MGPGLAVVGTPGSLSDVARTKFLRPRPLGDSVRFIARLRSVAIYWLLNERHQYHTRVRVIPLCSTAVGEITRIQPRPA